MDKTKNSKINTNNKNVFIVDSSWQGHVPSHHKLYIELFLNLGHNVISISPNPSEINSKFSVYKNFFQAFSFYSSSQASKFSKSSTIKSPINKIKVFLKKYSVFYDYLKGIFWKSIFVNWLVQGKKLFVLNKLIKHIQTETNIIPSIIFFPYIESIMPIYFPKLLLDWLFPYRWFCVYYNGGANLTSLFGVQRDNSFNSKYCLGIALDNENIIKKFQKRFPNKLIKFLPEYTENIQVAQNSQLVEQIKNQAQNRAIIGLFGALSDRKGIQTLLKTSLEAFRKKLPYYFIFVGQADLSQATKELIEVCKKNNNCFFHFERLNDEAEFAAVINQSNIMFAAYTQFPNSGSMLLKAAYLKKLSIVSEGYLMEDRIKRFETGLAIPEGNIQFCLKVINYLLQSKNLNGEPLKADFEGYAKFCSPKQIHLTLESYLDSFKI